MALVYNGIEINIYNDAFGGKCIRSIF